MNIWKYYDEGFPGYDAIKIAEASGSIKLYKTSITYTNDEGKIVNEKADSRRVQVNRFMWFITHIKHIALQ